MSLSNQGSKTFLNKRINPLLSRGGFRELFSCPTPSAFFLNSLVWFYSEKWFANTWSCYQAKLFSKNNQVSLNIYLTLCGIPLFTQILTQLKRCDLQKIVSGKTINLVSNDAQKMEEFFWALNNFLFSPIEILGSCTILLALTGWKALVGVSFYLISISTIMLLSHYSGTLRLKAAEARDKRLKVMNEVVYGVRAVKIYAWEMNFAEVIKQLRR